MAVALHGVSPLTERALQRINVTVGCVLFVFFYLYWVTVACVVLPWLSFSVPGVLNLLGLSLTTTAAACCYWACMAIDPGRVPPGWKPDSEEQGSAVQEVKKKDGAPRYCKKCAAYKPPRSHHCRVCERCVLRMDHHCPWVNGCIGHRNYKSFFQLLIFATLALVHSTLLLCGHGIHIVQSSRQTRVIRVGPRAVPHSLEDPNSGTLLLHVCLQTFAAAIALPASVAVVMLLVWHVRMVASNKTTMEHAEGVTAQIKAGSAAGPRERRRHPYDLGLVENLQEVLGEEAAWWCVPSLAPTPGSGLAYRTWYDTRSHVHDFFSF